VKKQGNRRRRVALPVVQPSPMVRCSRLSATITERTCIARWVRGQDRSIVRLDGPSVSGRGDSSVPYVSCRDCADGARRAGGAT